MKSGRFRAVKMISGNRRTATFATKTEARQWEAAQSAEAWAREASPILTASSAATQYLDDVQARMSRQTYIEKQSVFRLLFRFISVDIPIEDIGVGQSMAFLSAQFKARGGNAANGDRKNLCAWWSWSVEQLGVQAPCPFSRVKKFPENRHPRIVAQETGLRKILDEETGQMHLLLLTMLHTAARAGETFRLRWDDLDFERRTVRLWTRKRKGGGEEFDLVPMTEELAQAMLEHKKNARSVFVFTQDNGQPLHHDLDIMDRLCKKHGVPRFGFHGIRHLTASMLDAAGKPLALIQAVLRHKSATTTAKYLHSLRGARAELDDVFRGAEKKAQEGQLLSLQKVFGA